MGLTKKINFNANVKQNTDSDIFGTSQVTGSSSGINYVLNPSALVSTAGWATYQNTAQLQPVNGTGGSPTVTFARNTTNPLRDGADFLFSKPASNAQGNGVSYDFTIDSADRAQLLAFQFDYLVNSGLFNAGSMSTDSDVEAWIYDKTNNILIPVTPYKLASNSSLDPSVFGGVFQTNPNSTSYRLILHVATTNANAWALQLTNFSVGPQVILFAPSVSDWVPYTLVIGASTTPPTPGTAGVNLATWRRVGDSMEILYTFNQTTTGSDGSGVYLFPLPAGYSIDSSKIEVNNGVFQGICGSAEIVSGGTSWVGIVMPYDANNLSIAAYNAGNNPNLIAVASGGSGIGLGHNSNTSYSFHAKVPIVGWSSNTVTGNDADARVVAAYVGLTTTAAVGINSIIPYDTLLYDTHGGWNPGTFQYKVPVSGKYRVTATGEASGSASMYVVKTSVPQGYIASVQASLVSSGVQTVDCIAGDLLSVFTDTARSYSGGSSPRFVTSVMFERLSGPALPLATEKIAAVYYQDGAGTTSFTANLPIAYANKDIDTHDAVSSGRFTSPIAGTYHCSFSCNGGTSGTIFVWKNGVQARLVTPVSGGSGGAGSVSITVLAGDIIDFRPDTTMSINAGTTSIFLIK